MDVLQAIWYIIQSWDKVTIKTIQNCWHYTKILFLNNADNIDNANDIDEGDNLILNELHDAIKALYLSNAMGVKNFLQF